MRLAHYVIHYLIARELWRLVNQGHGLLLLVCACVVTAALVWFAMRTRWG